MTEKRVDPEYGGSYTFEEIAAFYKGKYKKSQIKAYWENECTPVKKKKPDKKKKGKEASKADGNGKEDQEKKEKKAKPQRPPGRRGLRRLEASKVMFLLCDVQERFRPAIFCMDHLIHTSSVMARASKIFEIPLIVTEQYPKALLNTVKEIDVSHGRVFEKTKFSMMTDEVAKELTETVKSKGITDIVIFGLETHVCVQQTVFDVMALGLNVHILTDGCSSQRTLDRSTAFLRMQAAGAALTTSESVLFELMREKDHEHFKAISALVKEPKPEPSLTTL